MGLVEWERGIDQIVLLEDGAVFIEVASVPGAFYEVEFNDGASAWQRLPFLVEGSGTRTFWIDREPPHTPSHPRESEIRLYRLRKADE